MKQAFLFICCLTLSPIQAGQIDSVLGSGSVTSDLGSGTITKSVQPGSVLADCSASGTFFLHTFTESGSSTQLLSTSIPEDGGGLWTGTNASDGSLMVSQSLDEVLSTDSAGNTKFAYWNTTAACPNYSVTAIGRAGGASSSHRLTVRGRWQDTGGGNGYRFQMDGLGGLILESVVNGVATTINAGTISGFVATTNYTLELRMEGTAISGYVNGVLKVSATNSAISDPGTVAFSLRNAVARITSITAAYL